MTRDTLEIAFFLFHIPLGLLMNASELVATAHALASAGVVLLIAVSSTQWVRVSSAVAYVIGAEVLWRMCDARIPWESGKYITAGILLLSLFRAKARRSIGIVAVVYFVLLLPSSAFTLLELPLDEARKQLSFNLSGPFSLAVATLLFSRIELDLKELSKIMRTLAMPVVAIVAVCAYSMATAGKISFAGESNQIASGRFGPNQVSTILGLGALFTFQALLVPGAKRSMRYLLMGLVVVFLTQAALTFSRGGVYAAVLAAVAGAMFALNDRRSRTRLVVLAVTLGVVAELAVMPALVDFTEGNIVRRFTDSDTTGRRQLVLEEFSLWMDHPLLGVGPGIARDTRQNLRGVAPHTEFTRLLAEHGALGLFAAILLAITIFVGLDSTRDRNKRMLFVVLTSWTLLTMMHSAMRLAAPGFCFGLGFSLLAVRSRARAQAPVVPRVRNRLPQPDADA